MSRLIAAALLGVTAGASAEAAGPIGEAWVALRSPEDAAALRAAGAGFAEGREGPWVLVHGDAAALDALEDAGFELRDRLQDHRRPLSAEGYHTPEEMAEALAELAERWPEQASLHLLGRSLEGRPVLGLRMGTPGAPAWRVLGTHHGDELSSAELALATAEALLEDDARMPGGFLEANEIWVVPHVNPDGAAAVSRYNARDVDLNRNYAYGWTAGEVRPGDAPFSEPETRAVRTLSLYAPFLAGLSMHSGAENIGYVWNYTTADSLEEERLAAMGRTYERSCGLESFWSTNGAAWYITYGDTNDWSYGLLGTLDFTVEISNSKTPPASELGGYLEAHLPAVGAFLAQPVALRGVVYSAATGAPIEATLSIPDAVALFPSAPGDGSFARLLDPGDYTLEIEAPGYAPAAVPLAVGSEPLSLEIPLEPQGIVPLRAEPALVSMGTSEVAVRLPGVDPAPDSITLWRPGADPLSVSRVGDSFPIPSSDLIPGPYSVIWIDSDGAERASPRALFAGAESDRVAISGVSLEDGALVIDGAGFGEGPLAWALWGDERPLEAVPVLEASEGALRLDAAGLPLDEPVDLLLLTAGAELVVLDALGTPTFDTDAPPYRGLEPADTGAPDSGLAGGVLLQPGCACSSGAPTAPWILLPALLLLRREWRPAWPA